MGKGAATHRGAIERLAAFTERLGNDDAGRLEAGVGAVEYGLLTLAGLERWPG